MKKAFGLFLCLTLLSAGLLLTSGSAQQASVSVRADQSEEVQAEVTPFVPAGQTRRYLVTYMTSQTTSAIRSATVVTVTNQFAGTCAVSVDWFAGFSTSPSCTANITLAPGFTADFCSRALPGAITTCNATCSPDLTFIEGRAVVNSTTNTTTTFCNRIGVSGRTYYTTATDAAVSAITDAKIVKVNAGNTGD